MSTVQLPGSNIFNSQMQMHTGNQKDDVSLAKELQHFMTKNNRKNGVIDQVKYKNNTWKENGHTDSIMFRIILMLKTKI